MSLPNSPSPPPRPIEPFKPQSQLPDLSLLSTPSFNSTLPFSRPTPVSGAFRRTSLVGRSRLAPSQRGRRTRSVATPVSHSSDGSLGDFSMENYTIDIAQLGEKEGGARPIGYEQAFQVPQEKHDHLPKQREVIDGNGDDEKEDILDGYEVDLGGLGDKQSSVVVEDAVQDRGEVPSDDEGPEDFTQNMEAWMRGSRKLKGEQDEEIAEGHEPDPDPEQHLREVMAEDGLAEESAFEPLATSTPALTRNHAIIEEGLEEEARMQAPPLIRGNTELLQDQAAEEVFDRISALQAEVEKMRMEDEVRRANYQALEKEHRDLREEYETAKVNHRNEQAVLRDGYDQSKGNHTKAMDTLQREKEDLIREYNSAMEQIRVLGKQSLEAREAKDMSLQAKFEQAVRDLEAVKVDSDAERTAAQSHIQILRQELEISKSESNNRRAQIESLDESNRIKVNELEVELDANMKEVALDRKESIDRANEAASLAESISLKDQENRKLYDEIKAINMELEHALEQLTETRRILETIEDENDRLVQENERQAGDIRDLSASINSTEPHEPIDTTSRDTQTDAIKKATHEAALQSLAREHQAALSTLAANHSKELHLLRNALLKAGEGMQKREKKLKKAHSDQLASLNHQTTQQQQPQRTPSPSAIPKPTATTETDLRSAILILNQKLCSANASIASLRAEVDEARQQREDAQQMNAIVNAELEIRFAEAVEVREREWRRRMELLLRERERMGKALMCGWGREEVGMTEGGRGQGYRYRFVERG